MAGLTDQPFRNICRSFGAALAVSEMSTADQRLWNSRKSETRLDLSGDKGLRVLQIAGGEPALLADAARAAADLGADILDINMGCPAKKVCRKAAGSALLQDEKLVGAILDAVVAATDLPVTLKIRTGWNPANRNGVRIARIAEAAGIVSLAVHGRTRACMFTGNAEFATIRQIKQAVSIPVFANGDIETVEKAREVLDFTQADAVMIGRGALGRPWFFAELEQVLAGPAGKIPAGQKMTGADSAAKIVRSAQSTDAEIAGEQKMSNNVVSPTVQRDTILLHLDALYRLYGSDRGVRVGRKHLTWYCKYLESAEEFRYRIVRVESAADQLKLTEEFLNESVALYEATDPSSSYTEYSSSDKERFQKENFDYRQTGRQEETQEVPNQSAKPQPAAQ
jgi:tRNA-dihydrouridine synthase B